MGASRRRNLLIGVAAVVGLLVVALLVAPSFIDLDARKQQVIAEVKKATGRDLTIAGPMSLSLLPTPSVTVTNVAFSNVAGSKEPQMAELKSVTVKPALFALLFGRIEPSEVILVEPRIVLEIDAQGKPNWEFAATPKADAAMPMSLDKLVIKGGTVLVSDLKDGVALAAEKVNVVGSVGSLDGPYALNGTATVRGAPMKVDLSVGAKGPNGHTVAVALAAKGGQLGFKGTASELSPNARLAGTASVAADQLVTFVGTLAACVGEPVPVLPALLSGKFGFDGPVEASRTTLSAKDFKLTVGESSGTGSLSVALASTLAVEGKVTMPRLDLDKILASLAQIPADAAPSPPPAGSGVPPTVTAKMALEIKELIYHKAAVRDVAIELDTRGGAVAVPKLGATLPGGMVLQGRSALTGDPAKPTVSGDFSLVGPKLRETLAWLEIDVGWVPASKLTQLSLKGHMSSINGNVDVRDAVFELDDMKATGGITVNFGVPLSIVTTVTANTVDLDAYLARPAGDQRRTPSSGRTAPAEPSLWTALAPSLGLKAKIAKLIYNGEAIGGVDVDLTLGVKTLTFASAKVSDLAGAKLDVRGSVTDYDTTLPRPDLSFTFDAPDLSRVLKVAGATAPAGIGHVTASGAVSGTIEALSLRKLSVSVMGYTSTADGTLAMPGASQGMPQAVSYKGSLGLNGHVIEGTIDAKLTGRPYVTADLRTTVLDLDKLAGGGAAPARGRPQPAASLPSFDTAPFRQFDATIKVAASTLVSPTSNIGNADLSATLKDGVLTISHFKGGMYGGTLELSGVVDARQPALSFDMTGNASNLSIGEMLRSAKGSNQFGNSLYPVAVGGRLDATGIVLKGGGASADQIRQSMTGGAQLGGHVDVVADKFLTAVGAAVTGVAGGVIDNTLGTALSVMGDKRGVGVGNLLNAISLVLNRYVNRNNPISGHVEIASGVLSDRNLIVQGNGVTAHVNTRTSFAAATTDTVISFVLAEDSSAPYLIASVRGPTSNPSYDVVRGTAKDPPGFVNTLTEGAGRVLHQLPHVPLPNIHIPNPFSR